MYFTDPERFFREKIIGKFKKVNEEDLIFEKRHDWMSVADIGDGRVVYRNDNTGKYFSFYPIEGLETKIIYN